ncbi:MAG: alpha/beta hydrolase [Acidobacteria bacterium]|nr:alpha/beta hydrolase [Acidobacteriota bacterium]
MSQTTIATPAAGPATAAPEIVGDDHPVFVFHPGLESFAWFAEARPARLDELIVARGCQLVGMGLPGHAGGGLIRFSERYIAQAADEALAVLEQRGHPAAAAIGVGLGGLVAIELAVRAEGRISCVIVDSLPGAASMEPWRNARGTVNENQYRRFVQDIAVRSGYPFLSGAAPCPTLVFACTEPPAALRGAPGTRLVELTCSPPACRSAARIFVREVERFLAAYA